MEEEGVRDKEDEGRRVAGQEGQSKEEWMTKRMGEEDEEHRRRIFEGQEGWKKRK